MYKTLLVRGQWVTGENPYGYPIGERLPFHTPFQKFNWLKMNGLLSPEPPIGDQDDTVLNGEEVLQDLEEHLEAQEAEEIEQAEEAEEIEQAEEAEEIEQAEDVQEVQEVQETEDVQEPPKKGKRK